MSNEKLKIDLPFVSEGFKLPQSFNYSFIVAAGFEDRTINILKRTTQSLPAFVLIIIYKGEGYSNKDEEIKIFLDKHNVKYDCLEFDRRNPQEFEDNFQSKLNILKKYSELLVDISSMSKLLIMNIIVNLNRLNKQIIIAYTEPKIYKPTKVQFNAKKKSKSLGASKLYFQTLDVFATVTTENLSSVAMANAPRFLVAFPTFNEDLLIALIQEFSPNDWLLVHGIPLRKKDLWRQEAIKFINRHVLSQVYQKQQTTISTYNYVDTFFLLEQWYQKVKFTHKYIIGPPTSKLQAVAVSLFKLYRQDIQILYPTPKSYLFKEHSNLSSSIHCICFNKFSDFVENLLQNRKKMDANAKIVI